MRLAAIALGLMAVAGPGWAQTTSGNSLMETCTSEDMAMQGFCIGFIIGAIEGTRYGLAVPLTLQGGKDATEINDISNTLLMNCPPADVQNGQYVDIVKNYLQDHPNERHYPARLIIHTSVSEAFPCP